jgi:hypothetical protein
MVALKQHAPFVKRSGSMPLSAAFGILVLVVVCVGSVYAWKIWGGAVQAQAAQPIDLEQLQVTPPPDWIRIDVADETFRDGSLSGLSLRDEDATYKIYRAFELHAWVAKVKRVHKFPDGRVLVDLLYRQPVAWVEIPGGMSTLAEKKDGALPIDADAVILPPEDLASQLDEFIRISIPDLLPWGVKGTPWGDPRLAGAARLAALLEGCWRGLGLLRIRALSSSEGGGPSPLYELITIEGDRVLWGSAPGDEQSGEATSQQKIARLKRVITRRGLSNSTVIVDLRLAAQPMMRSERR